MATHRARAARQAGAAGCRITAVLALIAVTLTVALTATTGPAGAAGGEFASVTTWGDLTSEESTSVAVDAADNVIVIGTFSAGLAVDFDPGIGVTNLVSNGADDVFVAKYDPDGGFLWAISFGGSTNERAAAVAVDPAGNVVVAGSFDGTVDFDPGAGSTNLSTTGLGGDGYVATFDPDGDLLWARNVGGTSSDRINDITVDSAGNVITTGTFQGTVDFDSGPGTTNLTSNGFDDGFVAKLDTSGALVWAASFGGGNLDRGSGVAVDTAGNIHVTGSFIGTVDFDPGPGTTNLTFAGGVGDAFVWKLTPAGALSWARGFGAGGFDRGEAIAVDNAGDVALTGSFQGTVDFDPGPDTVNRTSNGADDVFVSKLDPAGDLLWTAAFGSTGTEEAAEVAFDGGGNLFTAGTFEGTVDFDPGPDTVNRTSNGADDVFVSKLDPAGDLLWTAAFGGADSDDGSGPALDAAGNVITVGTFQGTVDFNPGPAITNRSSNGGSQDAFVSKLAANGLCDGLLVTVDLASGNTPTNDADVILGTTGDDVISALGGNDIVCGNGGNDTIAGGDGDDTITTGPGDDTIFGGAGADTIDGGGGTNTIQGNDGNDTIISGDGNDAVAGNNDDDTIDSGLGDDTVYGGPGADSIFDDGGTNTILGGPGNDTINNGGGDDLVSGNGGDDIVISRLDGNDTVYGVDGADSIFDDGGTNTILGGPGDDFISGGPGLDLISGNSGNDLVFGGANDDTIFGVDGDDTLDGGPGNDIILGGADPDIITGGADDDLLSGNAGDDTVNGGPGTDEVYGANGNDSLDGGTGADIILGGPDDDTIYSADGESDQVSGNAGTDTCTRDPALDTVFGCETLLP